MSVAQRVNVFDSADHLKEPKVRLGFNNCSVILDEVEEVTVLCPPHEYEDCAAALKDAVNSNDVGMNDFRENFNLARKEFLEKIFWCFALVDIFAGKFHRLIQAFVFVACFDDTTVRSFTDFSSESVAATL